jgi:hypothetical protein
MSEARPWGLDMPHSDGISRTIDFHEMELSLDIEHPATAQMIVLRSSRPQNVQWWPIIDVDELRVGEDLVIDTGLNQTINRKILLTKRNHKGVRHWCECIWKRRGQKDGVKFSVGNAKTSEPEFTDNLSCQLLVDSRSSRMCFINIV